MFIKRTARIKRVIRRIRKMRSIVNMVMIWLLSLFHRQPNPVHCMFSWTFWIIPAFTDYLWSKKHQETINFETYFCVNRRRPSTKYKILGENEHFQGENQHLPKISQAFRPNCSIQGAASPWRETTSSMMRNRGVMHQENASEYESRVQSHLASCGFCSYI